MLSELTVKALEYVVPSESVKAAVIQVFNDVSTTVKTIEKYFLIKKKNISEKERPKLKS